MTKSFSWAIRKPNIECAAPGMRVLGTRKEATMSLKITVRKNYLPACPSPFIVRSDSSDVVEFERLVDIMARGRTTLSKTDILGAMQLYKEELAKQLEEGKTVKTPTGSFFLCASGRMNAPDEAFLPNDQATSHEVRLHHRPEKAFEDSILAQLEIVREQKVDLSAPRILAVVAAGAEDSLSILPSGMLQVRGFRLRFDPKDQAQGVFFVGESGTEERSPFYPMIMPGSVLAAVPATLAAGSYTLVLRAAVNGKDVREAAFENLVLGPIAAEPAV